MLTPALISGLPWNLSMSLHRVSRTGLMPQAGVMCGFQAPRALGPTECPCELHPARFILHMSWLRCHIPNILQYSGERVEVKIRVPPCLRGSAA